MLPSQNPKSHSLSKSFPFNVKLSKAVNAVNPLGNVPVIELATKSSVLKSLSSLVRAGTDPLNEFPDKSKLAK